MDSVTTELDGLEGKSWWVRARRRDDIQGLRTGRTMLVEELARVSAYIRQIEDAAQQASAAPTSAGEWDAAGVVHAQGIAAQRAALDPYVHRKAALGICTSAPHKGMHGHLHSGIDAVECVLADLLIARP